jgi:hypothetical protein
MKNNNFISFVTALVIGLIIGGGIVGLIWHNGLKTSNKTSTIEQNIKNPGYAAIKEITTKEKEIYLNEYKKTAKRHFWSSSRVSVYMQQYNAMTYLMNKNHALAGFRLNAGIIGDPKDVIVVSAIDSTGKDDLGTPPVITNVEPCPPNCDDTTATPSF